MAGCFLSLLAYFAYSSSSYPPVVFLTGSLVGFLVWNWSPAKVFMGDVGSTFLGAFYLVIVKPLMTKYNPITILAYIFGFGVLFVLPFGFKEFSSINWDTMPNTIFLQVFFVVFCTTFLAYLFNAFALKNLNPTTVSIYIYLQPVLASIFAILWRADEIDNEKAIAALIIFIGVYLVSRQNKTKDKLS